MGNGRPRTDTVDMKTDFAAEEVVVANGVDSHVFVDLYASGVAVIGSYRCLFVFYNVYHEDQWHGNVHVDDWRGQVVTD